MAVLYHGDTPHKINDSGQIRPGRLNAKFKTVGHVATTAGVGRSAWFKDPDGNTIALFQPE